MIIRTIRDVFSSDIDAIYIDEIRKAGLYDTIWQAFAVILPVKTVGDLVELAKKRPGELVYASSGPGSAHHLDMQLLASMTGIKLVHAPYKGSLPALNDIVGGHVQMMFSDMSAALPLIQSGKMVRPQPRWRRCIEFALERSPSAPR